MSDPSYPAFPVISLVGFILVLVPLSWHLQAWNSGTCLYMFWTALASLNLFVNSIVWKSSVLDFAPVWCNISIRIIIATAVAIPAASLCINRRLYCIASAQNSTISRAQKQRAVIVDLSIGLGIPILQIILSYIVMGHRFDIYEELGCQPAIYLTPVAFPLVLCWPIAIGIVSAVYCVLTIHAFMRRRAQFQEFLSCHSSLTLARYFRLMALSSVELLCTIPISAYGIYLNIVSGGVSPWINWSNVHYDFSRVGQYPSVIWRSDYQVVVSFELSRWLVPFCAFIFFGFFGFAAEARRHYRQAVTFVWNPISRLSSSYRPHLGLSMAREPNAQVSSTGSLPVFALQTRRPPLEKFSSISSEECKSEEYESTYVDSPTDSKYVSGGSDFPHTISNSTIV